MRKKQDGEEIVLASDVIKNGQVEKDDLLQRYLMTNLERESTRNGLTRFLRNLREVGLEESEEKHQQKNNGFRPGPVLSKKSFVNFTRDGRKTANSPNFLIRGKGLRSPISSAGSDKMAQGQSIKLDLSGRAKDNSGGANPPNSSPVSSNGDNPNRVAVKIDLTGHNSNSSHTL